MKKESVSAALFKSMCNSICNGPISAYVCIRTAQRTLSLSAEESLPPDLQFRLSAGELALLLSHRRVWYMIAMDSELEEEDWALVLEEDVMLHPEVT